MGFLKTPNRINVLLSRAKHGMYIIGDPSAPQLVNMWAKVLKMLEDTNCIGPVLEIQCQQHPDRVYEIESPEDFSRYAPDGGCGLPCGKQLDCGHSCPDSCHSDLLHGQVKCSKPCIRPLQGCEHPCPLPCYGKCPKLCEVMLDVEVTLACGHVRKSLPCRLYQDQEQIVCKELVERTISGCGHTVTIECCVDVASPEYKCWERCGINLPCGHSCGTSCHAHKMKEADSEAADAGHKCTNVCGKLQSACAHECRMPCHLGKPCEPCPAACTVQCSHSRCTKSCSEPCTSCAENDCASACPHSRCTLPCAAPCDWVPCSLRCEKVLRCGHQCPSLCGAECPSTSFCQICCVADVKEMTVDLINSERYADVNLDETPCVFLPCSHFFSIKTLDKHVGIADYYKLDERGFPSALMNPKCTLEIDPAKIVCPECNRSLRDIPRYGRIVKSALLIQNTLKFITTTNSQYVPLVQNFLGQQKKLQTTCSEKPISSTVDHLRGSSNDQMISIARSPDAPRYKDALTLRKALRRFSSSSHNLEQSHKRIRQIIYSRSSTATSERSELSPGLLRTRAQILAETLLLRCDLMILWNFVGCGLVGLETQSGFKANRKDCKILFVAAEQGIHISQQVEALILWASFAALELILLNTQSQPAWPTGNTVLEEEALRLLDVARGLCAQQPNQTRAIFTTEIDNVEQCIHKKTFCPVVFDGELPKLLAAMPRVFEGTDGWYRCTNGHPFTIGECGGALPESGCPQCGAKISSHPDVAELEKSLFQMSLDTIVIE